VHNSEQDQTHKECTMRNKNDYPVEVATNWDNFAKYGEKSTRAFLKQIANLGGLSILDIGCGSGRDMLKYREAGASYIAGMDISVDMLKETKDKGIADELILGDVSQANQFSREFDIVVSKWALQCVEDYGAVISNIAKLLKPNGAIVLLVTHPLRQFLKKKRGSRDYSEKVVVESSLFGGQMFVNEPTHTFSDLLSPEFFKYFNLESFEEGNDIGCSEVDGDKYPQYVLLKAKKK